MDAKTAREVLRCVRLLTLAVIVAACGGGDSARSTLQWVKSYGPEMNRFNWLRQTDDGGYVAVGSGGDSSEDSYDWIMKTDAMGIVVWKKVYGDAKHRVFFHSAQSANNGGYIVTGALEDEGRPCLVARLDANAKVVWATSFVGVWGCRVWWADGSRYIVMGDQLPTIQGPWEPDGWIAELDDAGRVVWQKNYSDKQFNPWSTQLRALRKTADGGYVVAGSGAGTSGYGGGLVMKLESSGDIVWQKTYGGSWFRDIRQTSDGGYIALGESGYRGWLIRLDSGGNIVWQKHYGDPEVLARSVQQSADGGFIIAYDDEWLIVGAKLTKVDAQGNVLWRKIYGGSQTNTLEAAADGGYLIGATGWDYHSALLLKTDADGSIDECTVEEWSMASSESRASVSDGRIVVTNGNRLQVSSSLVLADIATVTQEMCPTPRPPVVDVLRH